MKVLLFIVLATFPALTLSQGYDIIEKYAYYLSRITPDPINSDMPGNCLPVAVKLQEHLVDKGHMAKIVAVEKDGEGHALVMYNRVGDTFDTLIDNGYATNFKLIDRKRLYDGSLGEYLGTCSKIFAKDGKCKLGRPF